MVCAKCNTPRSFAHKRRKRRFGGSGGAPNNRSAFRRRRHRKGRSGTSGIVRGTGSFLAWGITLSVILTILIAASFMVVGWVQSGGMDDAADTVSDTVLRPAASPTGMDDAADTVSDMPQRKVIRPGSVNQDTVSISDGHGGTLTKRILLHDTPEMETSHRDGEIISYDFSFGGWYASRETWLSGTSMSESPPIRRAEQENNFLNIPLEDLYRAALKEINEDRRKHGVGPVLLSDNMAAQAHAQSNHEYSKMSHWMFNGEKPYMTYSMMGGVGYARQNIASQAYDDPRECHSVMVLCTTIEPASTMKKLHRGMVYDDAHANWGHRDNILDPHHTHVSIGIVSSEYALYFVQHFEGHHIEYLDDTGQQNPIDMIGGKFVIKGEIPEKHEMSSIAILGEPLPSKTAYYRDGDLPSYSYGDVAAVVAKPLLRGQYDDVEGYDTVMADRWDVSRDGIHIEFGPISAMAGDGAYTIMLWLKDGATGEEFVGAERTFYLAD